jgi:hypothetical protein
MSGSRDNQFWEACSEGNLELMKKLPILDPEININFSGFQGDPPLHHACRFGRLSVVKYLVRIPGIALNKLNNGGETPLYIACQEGREDIVAALLAHERVDINKTKYDKGTPLWVASHNGHLSVVQHLLASEKMVNSAMRNEMTERQETSWMSKTASEIANEIAGWSASQEEVVAGRNFGDKEKRWNCRLIADLLNSFDQDPSLVRYQLRLLPGIREPYIGEVFALMVFYSDDFLSLKIEREEMTTRERKAKRFFHITRALPMELQMVLCHRMFKSPKDLVLRKNSELAFKKIAKLITF